MISDYLDSYTYDTILKDALARVPNTVDKREGSIIHDAIAPACAELAKAYISLKSILIQTHLLTACGKYLDMRVAEQGIKRLAATKAVKRAYFKGDDGNPMTINYGDSEFRLSSIDINDSLNYTITDEYKIDGQAVPGYYLLTCDVAGIVGNGYIGNLLPITHINGLAEAYMDDIVVLARDEETDEELRIRYQESVEAKSFGGNVAQYREWVLGLNETELAETVGGIGAVQVYPVWDGGGTVKVSILGIDHLPVPGDSYLIKAVQEYLDPENIKQGTGLGIAPIGHRVKVDTPGTEMVKVEATVYLKSGADQELTKAQIQEAVEDHFHSVRKTWGNPDESNNHTQDLFISQVNYAILSVPDVQNVTDITLNGQTGDLEFAQTALSHPVPILGEVILHVK